MTTPLLMTKLYAPAVRPEQVPRPRLIEQLNRGLHRKLTLISAPAGFGKTTLLGEWAQQSTVPVAWVSLDTGDSDPARFWAYFVAALQRIHGDVGESTLAALQSPQLPLFEVLLTGLINEIAQVSEPFVLVLDDFHVLTGQPVIHDGLMLLLDNLPPQMHLILSSRADPPWPLSRLRARREITELRVNDLRFTSEEAAAFLLDVMKLDLSPGDVAALEERTEGWIAGLQLAGLSMRGRRDLSAFIKAFSGSHRFILDYLVEEVLDQQPGEVQAFLLKTSILERMSAPLCNAVTGTEDSETMLAQLERANLFVVPLDDERRWYRYHRLFADLLHKRLERDQPDRVPALHRHASEWYESTGQVVEAVRHALAAGDVESVERLVTKNALAMIYHGELATVATWLDALPGEVMRSRPPLALAYAWVLAYAGQLDRIEPLLQDTEQALAGSDEHPEALLFDTAEGQHIPGHIAANRAYVTALKGDWSRAAELARLALDLLPEADLAMRGLTACTLGCVLRSQGQLAAAGQAFSEAIAISRAAGDSHLGLGVDALWEQAVLQLGQGQLHEVMSTCEEALQLASQYTTRRGRPLPVTGYTYTLMSSVLCEWNDLESALRYAREGLELCRQWGQADALAQGCLRLAKVLHAVGQTDGALEAIREAKQIARGLIPGYVVAAEAYEARIQLAQGDMAAVARWLQESGLTAHDELDTEYRSSYLTLARVLLAQGRLDGALRLLVRLLEMAEVMGAIGLAVDTLVLQALVLQARGQGDQAVAALERALRLAEPEGYVRVFIDEGAPMGELLRQAAARGIRLEYVGRLLAALESETAGQRQAVRLASSPLVEPLSKRELQVLRLLTTHLSSTEIAQELTIAVNTVRSHIKNIYGKLDVHGRREAVARARELGLL